MEEKDKWRTTVTINSDGMPEVFLDGEKVEDIILHKYVNGKFVEIKN